MRPLSDAKSQPGRNAGPICAAALDKRDTYSGTSRVAENGVADILYLAMFLS